jgi:hypothetical protein
LLTYDTISFQINIAETAEANGGPGHWTMIYMKQVCQNPTPELSLPTPSFIVGWTVTSSSDNNTHRNRWSSNSWTAPALTPLTNHQCSPRLQRALLPAMLANQCQHDKEVLYHELIKK